jgi:hypothetical protein
MKWEPVRLQSWEEAPGGGHHPSNSEGGVDAQKSA